MTSTGAKSKRGDESSGEEEEIEAVEGNGSAGSLRILVVDDEANIRKTLSMYLESEGHKVVSVGNITAAMAEASRKSIDLAFVDVRLGPESGLDLIPQLLSASPWTKIVMITAYASIETAIEAIKRGATDYLPKPFMPAQVELVTRKVIELQSMEQRISSLQDEVNRGTGEIDLNTQSPVMQRALNLARQVADSEAVILFRGESGTGKTMLARTIHNWSSRAKKPFITVSCPSLSTELLESEMFGHARGAFTGAMRENPGRIAACDGGTLFLDEIGDLPLNLQPKFLRFIQDRQYERVGDPRTRQADVRMIGATNLNLEEMVKENKFREDLYYRLNVVEIELPPLRDRREDIITLGERILSGLAQQYKRQITGFSEEAKQALYAYNWPGNIRELRNVIERAVLVSPPGPLGAQSLRLKTALPISEPQLGDLVTLEKLEEMHIRRVLAATPSLEEAARALGIDAATLWRRRKKYGI